MPYTHFLKVGIGEGLRLEPSMPNTSKDAFTLLIFYSNSKAEIGRELKVSYNTIIKMNFLFFVVLLTSNSNM